MIASIFDVTDTSLLVKTIAATIVFLLAGFQVLLAARFTGVMKLAAVHPRSAAKLHRVSGRLTLALAVAVAVFCIVGPGGATSPTRVALHSIFGALVFALLAVKFTLLKLLKRGRKQMPILGSAIFVAFGAIWITSVADFAAGR